MSDAPGSPIYVAVIGSDTLLAARPADWVQLTRACKGAGFDFVAPVSWGEELIAQYVGERMATAGGPSTKVSMSCPFVGEALRTTPPAAPILKTVSPPVACARYLRAAFHPRQVHVTYIGACPGAVHPEVDQEYLPEVLFGRLAEAGIMLSTQPRHLDAELPVDRARYASLPGGAPSGDWLSARAGARLTEAAPITVDVVAQAFGDESMLVDLAHACRCICARDRWGISRLEPPRAPAPVVKSGIPVTDEPVTQPGEPIGPLSASNHDRRASFAENGLSAGEAVQAPEVQPDLSNVREPW
jgi:hypothetical protein